jgi:hypothetical protein
MEMHLTPWPDNRCETALHRNTGQQELSIEFTHLMFNRN